MAYVTATLKQKDAPLPDGRVRIVVAFMGDAGEPTRDRELYVDGGMTAMDIRRWCIAEASRMGTGKTVIDALTIGQSINLTPIAPPAPPLPTARQVWLEKANRLARLRSLGAVTAGTLLDEITALAEDVRVMYQAGWIADV